MRQSPIHYCGIEIDENVINRIKQIAKVRHESNLYETCFRRFHSVYDLCCFHDTELSQENIILGEDWFITYSIDEYETKILDWVALDDIQDKMTQSIEMLNVMKNILLLSEGKNIHASMRHDTSYQFYLKFLEKGYFEEWGHTCTAGDYKPYEMQKIVNILKNKYYTYEEYFSNENREEFPEYEKYIFHNVNFEITDKFVKQYKRIIGS